MMDCPACNGLLSNRTVFTAEGSVEQMHCMVCHRIFRNRLAFEMPRRRMVFTVRQKTPLDRKQDAIADLGQSMCDVLYGIIERSRTNWKCPDDIQDFIEPFLLKVWISMGELEESFPVVCKTSRLNQ